MLNTSQISEIQNLAETQYFAPDGLLNTNTNDDHPPYPPATVETAGCDNGMLFAAYYYWLLYLQGGDITWTGGTVPSFDQAVTACEVPTYPGLFNRNPGRNTDLEEFDDYVGICAGSVLCQLVHPRNICSFGANHGWFFDNTDPSNPAMESWRQGSEVAYYMLCKGDTPELPDFLWLVLSMIISGFYSTSNTSAYLLTWLRLRSLQLKFNRDVSTLSNVLKLMLTVIFGAGLFWRAMLYFKTGGKGIESIFGAYFTDPHHPCVQLSKGIVY